MNIEEVEELEGTRITTKNAAATIAATPKVRELPRKMHVQTRNHENYDELCPQPSI